ncbi:protein kinase [Streptomyces sp. NPDC059994]|uniref:protein kinase n=1 Tax=Streptomyces sp. NPDC059994 TaxID=3347029 RepID=UPI003684A078
MKAQNSVRSGSAEPPLDLKVVDDMVNDLLAAGRTTSDRMRVSSLTRKAIGALELLLAEDLGFDDDPLVRGLYREAYGLMDLSRRPGPDRPLRDAYQYMRSIGEVAERLAAVCRARLLERSLHLIVDEPHKLPKAVRAMIQPNDHRLLAHRHGCTLWEVELSNGRHLAKVGWPAAPDRAWTASAPAREGAVLRRLGAFAVYGVWEHGTWNVQTWREGVDLWDTWKPYRAADATPEVSLAEAAACASAVAELHARGWIHGNIRPAHLLLSDEKVAVIDLALAQGHVLPPAYDFAYPGCLVHYEAPEIARSVLATGTAKPTFASDVYALGASLLVSATGVRAVPYDDDADRSVQRQAVADGRRHEVELPGVLGKTIEAMLSHHPGDRPTIHDVHLALMFSAR